MADGLSSKIARMQRDAEDRRRADEVARAAGEDTSGGGGGDDVTSGLVGLAVIGLFLAAMSEASKKQDPAPAAPQGSGSADVSAPSREAAAQPQQSQSNTASMQGGEADATPQVSGSSAEASATADTNEITGNAEDTDSAAVVPPARRPSAWEGHSHWERRFDSDRPYYQEREDQFDCRRYYSRWSRLEREYRLERRYRLH